MAFFSSNKMLAPCDLALVLIVGGFLRPRSASKGTDGVAVGPNAENWISPQTQNGSAAYR
jgi:hypothetical protein